jgi:quercetin dioxygenase-like cupin family protein
VSVPCGPGAALLTSAERYAAGDPPGRVDIFHLRIPPHGRTPEHDHGSSRAVLVPLSGVVRCHQGARVRTLPVGRTARLGAGERVRLVNPSARPASLLVVIGASGVRPTEAGAR